VTEHVLPQDEVRDLTDEETDQISGGALPFGLALKLWIQSRQESTDGRRM
jgi:hypothetical protein